MPIIQIFGYWISDGPSWGISETHEYSKKSDSCDQSRYWRKNGL